MAHGSDKVRRELAGLGYPGFAHMRGVRRNPAEVQFRALNEADLNTRVAEGLPSLAHRYADIDWDWLVQSAKLRDRQNRLGFATALALQLATKSNESELQRFRKLKEYLAVL